MTFLGKKTKKQFVVIAVGPGGYFNTEVSASPVLAAYTLLPEGQSARARMRQQAPPRAISPGPGREPQPIRAPVEAVRQPIPFSHKRHSQAGMKCDACHQKLETGEQLQIPGGAECMRCHQNILKDTAVIQKLGQLEKEGQPLSWTRLYQLPEFVFFSHEKHMNGKVDCETCHG
ncbi:MAG: hypothetical protein DMG05_19755, partial [Acidobacteria bacterium]